MKLQALLLTFVSASSGDRGFPTPIDALNNAFPKASTKVETLYLSAKEIKAASKLAGREVRGVVRRYVAIDPKTNELVGYAYIDTHKVRAKRESLLVAVNLEGQLESIQVLGFAEPREYLPREKWYQQFEGRALDEKLALKVGIDGITGATLTARATVNSARQTLAISQILAAR